MTMPPPDQAPRRPKPPERITLSEGQLAQIQVRALLTAAEAVRRAGAARALAAIATINEPGTGIDDVYAKLRDLARTEGADAVAAGRHELPAELRAACYLFQFSSARLLAAVTTAQVVVPAEAAHGLSVVEQWVQSLAPPPGPGDARA
jgi:hypothetical protein